MKCGFIRTLWGGPGFGDGKRSPRMWREAEFALNNRFDPPFVAFVMGKDNQKALEDLGIETELVTDKPWLFPPARNYRNRFACVKQALKRFDEVISLDWDCYPERAIPENFWNRMRKGAKFQASLVGYRYGKCNWRTAGRNRLPNGAFVYYRDPEIVAKMDHLWETEPTLSSPLDEMAMAYWTDQQMGGWKSEAAYCEYGFEPYCFAARGLERGPIPAEFTKQKEIIFIHSHRLGCHFDLLKPGSEALIERLKPFMFKW